MLPNQQRFVQARKCKGYGHDLLTSLGKTADGLTVDITADQIMSVGATYRRFDSDLTITHLDPIRYSEVRDVAKALGVTTGSLDARTGSAVLFKPVKDEPAAKMSALIEAVSAAAEIDPGKKSLALAETLGRPSGVIYPGANIIAPNGELVQKIAMPPIFLVEIRAPGEKREIPQPTISDNLLNELKSITTLNDMLEATAPLMEQYSAGEQLVSDILEIQNDLPPFTGLLPAVDTGVAIPFEQTNEGFKMAQEMRDEVKKLLPSLSCYITRSWKERVV